MRKRGIVLQINQESGIKQKLVKEVVNRTFNAIINALKNGERIELRNFGIFYLRKRKQRTARNPKTGEIIAVPEKRIVVFKPGLQMKKNIK